MSKLQHHSLSVGYGLSTVTRMLFRIFQVFSVFAFAMSALGPSATALPAELPAGTNLEIRLPAHSGSRVSHRGDQIRASVIAPVLQNGAVVIPQGSILAGSVSSVHSLGFGVKRPTATLELHFNSLQIPGERPVPLTARVLEVETAKERVNSNGVIGGIHPVANLSSGVSIFISALLMEPGIALPALGVKFLIARSPDPEIYFPAGTELIVQVSKSAVLPSIAPDAGTLPPLSVGDDASVRQLLAKLPQQQSQRGLDHPSDLANVMLLGKQDQIDRAFHAAGWTGAQAHNAIALYLMFHSVVVRRGYSMAPMARLRMNGVTQQADYQKSLDTFAKRHHIRLWQQPDSEAWLSAATEDLSFTVNKMHVTHASDSNIDNERAKVVNDLAMTGCLDSASILPRDDLRVEPQGTKAIVTDGKIAVLRLNSCKDATNVITPDRHPVSSRVRHITSIVARDFLRSNPLTLGYSVARLILSSPDPEPGAQTVTLASARSVGPSDTVSLSGRQQRKASAVLLSNRWKRPTVLAPPVSLATGYSSFGR